MPRSFPTFYNRIDYVEADDDTISLYENRERLMSLPKPALSAMVTNYDNILLDFDMQYEKGRKYFSDDRTIIYMKNVLEESSSYSSRHTNAKVFCILQVPFEITLTRREFQLMLIRAVISCRIEADDSHRTRFGLEYELSSTKTIIFHDRRKFSICDESTHEEFDMPINALAKMVLRKKAILCDLRDDDYFGETVYWSDKTYQIKTEYSRNYRVLCFAADYKDGPVFIRMRDRIFETMVYIATGGPPWTDKMEKRMREIRKIYWNSIPINTVKSIEVSRSGRKFTLINEVNGDTLTLPREALDAAKKYKKEILADLEDDRFQPTYERDYMNEYWADGDYAIRTGVFYNLYRSIDCNVVRFTRLRDNYYKFVLQKRSFLWLLDQ